MTHCGGRRRPDRRRAEYRADVKIHTRFYKLLHQVRVGGSTERGFAWMRCVLLTRRPTIRGSAAVPGRAGHRDQRCAICVRTACDVPRYGSRLSLQPQSLMYQAVAAGLLDK